MKNIIEHLNKCSKTVQSEEATKLSMVLPVIQALGYDIYDPTEVVPEMVCDIQNKNDRVDFSIFTDGVPVIIIECKTAGANLEQYTKQLSKYFVSSKAKYAILTNGLEYWIYTDLQQINLMDSEPFFKIDFSKATDSEITFFMKLSKENFDESRLRTSAQVHSVSGKIREEIAREMAYPSGDFLCMIAKRCYTGIVTQQVLEEINDIISDNIDEPLMNDIAIQDLQTDDVARAYEIISSIIRSRYEDAVICNNIRKSYVSVTYYNKYHTICRLSFSKKKSVFFPSDGYKSYTRIDINDVEELNTYSNEILASYLIAYNNRLRFL